MDNSVTMGLSLHKSEVLLHMHSSKCIANDASVGPVTFFNTSLTLFVFTSFLPIRFS